MGMSLDMTHYIPDVNDHVFVCNFSKTTIGGLSTVRRGETGDKGVISHAETKFFYTVQHMSTSV